jgi:DsbC/DsbD-like thiol-disulfide interchange protein
MKLRSLALFVLSFAAFLGTTVLTSAKPGPVRNGEVTVELVAHDASIQPGKTFRVAVKLDHDPHWHSYWINAGTGYPTSIAWTLPDGFKAGPILWPTPHVVKDSSGKVTGNGYEDQIFLYVDITPPADLKPGTSVTLKALVEWLMCEDVCKPGDANVELTLPVKEGKAAPNMNIARLFNNALTELPRQSDDWAFSASRDG